MEDKKEISVFLVEVALNRGDEIRTFICMATINEKDEIEYNFMSLDGYKVCINPDDCYTYNPRYDLGCFNVTTVKNGNRTII